MLQQKKRKVRWLNIITLGIMQLPHWEKSWSINQTLLTKTNFLTSGLKTCLSLMIWKRLRFKTNSSLSRFWKIHKHSFKPTEKDLSKLLQFWEKFAGRSNLMKKPWRCCLFWSPTWTRMLQLVHNSRHSANKSSRRKISPDLPALTTSVTRKLDKKWLL